jgi:hypothetical protein
MSFSLGEKDKTDQTLTSKKVDKQKHPLELITDPERKDELERGGMIMGPHHPGFRSEQQQGHTIETNTTQQLRLPKGSVPPGARFDPIFAGDESRQYGQQPIAGPDNDEILPPEQEQSSPNANLRPSIFQDQTKRIGEGFGRGNFGGGGGRFSF